MVPFEYANECLSFLWDASQPYVNTFGVIFGPEVDLLMRESGTMIFGVRWLLEMVLEVEQFL